MIIIFLSSPKMFEPGESFNTGSNPIIIWKAGKKQHFDFGMVHIRFKTVQIVFRDGDITKKVSLEPW